MLWKHTALFGHLTEAPPALFGHLTDPIQHPSSNQAEDFSNVLLIC